MRFSDSPHFLLKDFFDSVVGSSIAELLGGSGGVATEADVEAAASALWYRYHCRNGVEWVTPGYWNSPDQIWPYRSYLRGARKTIIVRGYWTDLYVKSSGSGFIGHRFAPFPNLDHIDGNFFRFLKGDSISLHSNAASAFNNGDEVYFRKGSPFHIWLAERPE